MKLAKGLKNVRYVTPTTTSFKITTFMSDNVGYVDTISGLMETY